MKKSQWVILFIALFLLAMIPLLQSLAFGFFDLDDPKFITDNPLVSNFELKDITSIFTRHWGTPYLKPLVYLSWALDYKLGGGEAWIFHLHNLILHSLNTLLVFLVVHRVFVILSIRPVVTLAFIVSLFFAWHPLKVESVVWAMQRKDLLYAFYYLLAVLFYIIARQRKRYALAILSGIAFLFSLASKSMAITLFPVLVILELMLFRVSSLKIRARFLVPVGMVFLLGLIAYGFPGMLFSFMKGADTGRAGLEIHNLDNEVFFALLSPTEVIVSTGHRLFIWFKHLIWPLALAPTYPLPAFLHGDAISSIYWIETSILFGAFILFFLLYQKKRRWPLMILLMFLFMMAPPLLQSGHDTTYVSDRFLYLSSLLFIVAFVVIVSMIPWKKYLMIVFLIPLLLLAFATVQQVSRWKSNKHLWEYTTGLYDAVPSALNNLGRIYFEENMLDRAGACFSKAILYQSIEPDYHNNLGGVLASKHLYSEALKEFEIAIKLDSTNSVAWSNKGLALQEMNRINDAARAFERAVKLDPGERDYHINLAKVLYQSGDYEEAVRHYSIVESFDPSDYQALVGGAMAYTSLGNTVRAENLFSRAIAIEPGNTLAYVNRGVMYANQNRSAEAMKDFRQALELNPQLGNVWYMLALILKDRGKQEEACAAMGEAGRLGIPKAIESMPGFCSELTKK